MENKSHALAAGAFLVLLSALLAAMAFWLMRDSGGQRVFEISSAYSVSGLQPQAGVRYKGVTVGRVVSIGLDPDMPGNVLVRLVVNDQVVITPDTVASLGYQGVTGLAFVQLDESVGVNATSPAASAARAAQFAGTSQHPPRIALRPGLLTRLSEQGEHLLTQFGQTAERAGTLLAPDNQQRLMQAVDNMGRAATSLQRLTEHLDRTLVGKDGSRLDLPRLAGQLESSFKSMQATSERLSASAEVVRNSAAEFKKVSVRMNEPGGTLDRVARGTEALSASGQAVTANLVPRLNRVADDAARTARHVGQLTDTLTDNPQSLLFGRGSAAPGPGEPGFVAPTPNR